MTEPVSSATAWPLRSPPSSLVSWFLFPSLRLRLPGLLLHFPFFFFRLDRLVYVCGVHMCIYRDMSMYMSTCIYRMCVRVPVIPISPSVSHVVWALSGSGFFGFFGQDSTTASGLRAHSDTGNIRHRVCVSDTSHTPVLPPCAHAYAHAPCAMPPCARDHAL